MIALLLLACAALDGEREPVEVNEPEECNSPVCESADLVLYNNNPGDNYDGDTLCVWSCVALVHGTVGLSIAVNSNGACVVTYYEPECGGGT